MADRIESSSSVDPDDNICGTVFIGAGNVYANVRGALMSAPINVDGSFSRRVAADWCEVESVADAPDEVAAAMQALGVRGKASPGP